MQLQDITLMLFATCNCVRVLAYLPQIHKLATDANAASGISFSTWSLFLVAHLSTIAYALVNQSDWWLAACFSVNALGCIAILSVAYWRSRHHAARRTDPKSGAHTLAPCFGAPPLCDIRLRSP